MIPRSATTPPPAAYGSHLREGFAFLSGSFFVTIVFRAGFFLLGAARRLDEGAEAAGAGEEGLLAALSPPRSRKTPSAKWAI